MSNDYELKNCAGNNIGKQYSDTLHIVIKNSGYNIWESSNARIECHTIKSNLFFDPIEIKQDVNPNQSIELTLPFFRIKENNNSGNILISLILFYKNEPYNSETIMFKKNFNFEEEDLRKKILEEKERIKELNRKEEEEREKRIRQDIIDERNMTIEFSKKKREEEEKRKAEEEKKILEQEKERKKRENEERKRNIEEAKRKREEEERKKAKNKKKKEKEEKRK
jgi:hypothetical protein